MDLAVPRVLRSQPAHNLFAPYLIHFRVWLVQALPEQVHDLKAGRCRQPQRLLGNFIDLHIDFFHLM